MDLDTRCISLEYIQSYFDLRKNLVMEPGWLERRFLHPAPQFLMRALTGIDEEAFYCRAGIPQDRGPGYLISTRQCMSLVDQGLEALDIPFLGLAMGKMMTISHYGTQGVSAITRKTFGECLDAIAHFNRGLFPPLDMPGFVRGKDGVFAIRDNLPLGRYRCFFHELVVLSFTNIFQHLLGGMQPYRVCFGYPEPEWGNVYRHYFKCPVRFDQPETCIVGDAELAEFEIPMANRLSAMTAESTLLEKASFRAMGLMPLRLRSLLMRYYGAFPSLDMAARELGVSGRTLRRKLSSSGTSYQEELDQVRQKLAREYFRKGGRSITELSLALGYNDSSSFAKAFRRWSGMSPSAFLQQQQQKDVTDSSVNPGWPD